MVQVKMARVHPMMGSDEMPWPARKSTLACGFDCVAAIDEPITMHTSQVLKVPLGFALALPEGWEAQIRPRSGLASEGIIMPNSPGTVDADYRGEVSALLFLLPRMGKEPMLDTFIVRPGARICQMVIAPVPDVEWSITDRSRLPPTARGEGGFGSTGT